MSSLFTVFREELDRLWTEIRNVGGPEGLLPILRPVPPYVGPAALSPVTTLATMLGLAILSGVALTAFGVLFACALGIYLIMTEVLGITIEVRPFPA